MLVKNLKGNKMFKNATHVHQFMIQARIGNFNITNIT